MRRLQPWKLLGRRVRSVHVLRPRRGQCFPCESVHRLLSWIGSAREGGYCVRRVCRRHPCEWVQSCGM